MKIILSLIVTLGVLFSPKLKAQIGPGMANQDQNHPTIASVKVKYKAVPQGTLAPGAIPSIQSIPEGIVTLKQNVNVATIYLKIINTTSNTILYQVNYPINSPVVTNNQAKKLFENNNGAIFISNGEALILKPYVFEIQTADGQGNLSPIYKTKQ